MDCKYCGKPAGFLRWQHTECKNKHEASITALQRTVKDAAMDGKRWGDIEDEISRCATEGFIPESRIATEAEAGMKMALEHALDDNILDEHEEENIMGFLESAAEAPKPSHRLARTSLESVRELFDKAAAIRLILQGTNPASKQGHVIPAARFNFMKSEQPIWYFEDVEYHAMKSRVEYRGGSRGASFRVAKGVYLRAGGFKARREVIESQEYLDTGTFCITTKHVYFSGETHRFRIRHDRVVGYDPTPDGISLTRDRANARPEWFKTGDGWFTYNLAANAQNLEV